MRIYLAVPKKWEEPSNCNERTFKMPKTKSAEKHIKTDEKSRMRHKSKRSELKSLERKIVALAEKKDMEGLKKILSSTFSKLDKAVKSGTLHKNNVSRKKSRLAKLAK